MAHMPTTDPNDALNSSDVELMKMELKTMHVRNMHQLSNFTEQMSHFYSLQLNSPAKMSMAMEKMTQLTAVRRSHIRDNPKMTCTDIAAQWPQLMHMPSVVIIKRFAEHMVEVK